MKKSLRREMSGYFAEGMEYEIRKRKEALQKSIPDERTETQKIIINGLLIGMSNEEIISELNKKFPNSKLTDYYNGYIEHQRAKIIQDKLYSRDDEER